MFSISLLGCCEMVKETARFVVLRKSTDHRWLAVGQESPHNRGLSLELPPHPDPLVAQWLAAIAPIPPSMGEVATQVSCTASQCDFLGLVLFLDKLTHRCT